MKAYHTLLISLVLGLLAGLAVPGFADDTEIYVRHTDAMRDSDRPNILFMLDNSGSMSVPLRDKNGNFLGDKKNRLTALKEALLPALDEIHGVNVGLARFATSSRATYPADSDFSGIPVNAPILFPVAYIDENMGTVEGKNTVAVNRPIIQSSDDAVQIDDTGEQKMSLTDPELLLIQTMGDSDATMISPTIALPDGSTYKISLESHKGNIWSYRVQEISGKDLSHWVLGLSNSCNVTAHEDDGQDYGGVGTDGSTDFYGIKWDIANDAFNEGVFSFTLDKDYPAGLLEVLVKASTGDNRSHIMGPICDDSAKPIIKKVEKPINHGHDDAVEFLEKNNSFDRLGEKIYLGTDPYNGETLVGLRFDGLDIPQGTIIKYAEIELTSTSWYEEDNRFEMIIEGAANDGKLESKLNDGILDGDASGAYLGSPDYKTNGSNKGYLSGTNFQQRTAKSVHWKPPTVANKQIFNTPDIRSIIEEIVGRSNWSKDNGLVLLFKRESGSSGRGFYTYNNQEELAPPLLRLYWTMSGSSSEETTPVTAAATSGLSKSTEHATEDPSGKSGSFVRGQIWLGKNAKSRETTVGVWFPALDVPQGVYILDAKITFVPTESDGNLNLIVHGEKTGDADLFLHASDKRPRARYDTVGNKTTQSVVWNNVAPDSNGKIVVEVKNIIKEIIELSDWNQGNDVAFFFTRNPDPDNPSTGYTRVKDWKILVKDKKGSTDDLPKLEVSYSDSPPPDAEGSSSADETEQAEAGKRVVGLRFESVDIPKDATVTNATIEFQSTVNAPGAATLIIKAEKPQDADGPDTFSGTNDVLGRRASTTSASFSWETQGWDKGVTYPTKTDAGDLTEVVQEIVNDSNWCGGGSLVFIIEEDDSTDGNALRKIKSYDDGPTSAPVLKVEYDPKNTPENSCLNQNFFQPIVHKYDDAEELREGTDAGHVFLAPGVGTGGTALELGQSGDQSRLVGFRFWDVPIRQGAEVLSAHLTFYAHRDRSGSATLEIRGEKAPNSAAFEGDPKDDPEQSRGNLSGRDMTTAVVEWSTTSQEQENDLTAWEAGKAYRTPNIATVVQEILDQEGEDEWKPYNDMTFFITGNGQRDVLPFEDGKFTAATLHIQTKGRLGDSDDYNTVRRHLKETVNWMELPPNSATPLVDALYESAQYYRGQSVVHGKSRYGDNLFRVSSPGTYSGGTLSKDDNCSELEPLNDACVTEEITDSPDSALYDTPIQGQSSCQTNHIVLLTDGIANVNRSGGASSSGSSLIEDMISSACVDQYPDPDAPGDSLSVTAQSVSSNPDINDPNRAERCGIDLAKFLKENDQVEDSWGNKNNVITHTIGFQLGTAWNGGFSADDPPVENENATKKNRRAVKFLKQLADYGGGTFYHADSVEELKNAFIGIVNYALKSSATSFAAPGISVNRFSKIVHNNCVHYAQFKPSANRRWHGNVKKYCIVGGKLLDMNNQEAVDNKGMIKATAQSYWSQNTVDGANVILGGAGEQLKEEVGRNGRNILTALADAQKILDSLRSANTTELENLLGVTDDEERIKLINWIYGQDVNDEDNDGDTDEDRWMIADPLHSSPQMITYQKKKENTSAKAMLFVGTNEGMIRMFDAETGQEKWAFLPKEMLGKQVELMQNNFIAEPSFPRIYGIDGTPTFWMKNKKSSDIDPDEGDFVKLFIGMRRGGKNIYALDVTGTKDDPGSEPELMWTIKGGAGDFEQLGQTWSLPKPVKVNPDFCPSGSEEKKSCVVLLFGGGYDTSQDNDANFANTDNVGNAIYMVDAETGELVWSASGKSNADLNLPGMDCPIPSDLAVLDTRGDGWIDRIYVGDVCGQIWRVDLDKGTSTGGRVANLSSENNNEHKRRFFYSPDRIQTDVGDVVVISSGTRPHPLEKTVQNRFYAFLDIGWTKDEQGFATLNTVEESDMLDVTTTWDSEDQTTDFFEPDPDTGNKGWYFTLPSTGEKGLASPVIVSTKKKVENKVEKTINVLFTTYTPPDQEDACGGQIGKSKLYAFNLLTGESALEGLLEDQASDNEETDSEEQSGETETGLGKELGDGIADITIMHTKESVLGLMNTKIIQVSDPPEFERTFWMQKTE
jgi:type IV pilus assembly protein PilY1